VFGAVECGRVVGFGWRCCWEGEIAGAVCRCHGGDDVERFMLEVELVVQIV